MEEQDIVYEDVSIILRVLSHVNGHDARYKDIIG